MYSHTLIPVLISHLFVWDTVIYMVMPSDPSHLLLFHLSLSCLCMLKTNRWASTEGLKIRLFKWIGHYTGDAWGYRQKNTITWYLPALLLSNHPFSLCSTPSAGIHFLPPQSWQITRGKKINKKSTPKWFPWKSLWLQFLNQWLDPTCEWASGIVSKGNKRKGEGQKQTSSVSKSERMQVWKNETSSHGLFLNRLANTPRRNKEPARILLLSRFPVEK